VVSWRESILSALAGAVEHRLDIADLKIPKSFTEPGWKSRSPGCPAERRIECSLMLLDKAASGMRSPMTAGASCMAVSPRFC
jgi:hypothetical protein